MYRIYALFRCLRLSRSLCDQRIAMAPRLHSQHPLVDGMNEDTKHISVIEHFVTDAEQEKLMNEIEKSMRRKRYQYDHWDGAIEGFRETEKSNWMAENSAAIERLTVTASQGVIPDCSIDLLPSIHVLDLAPDGCIKPHVDSVKFCGRVIAGISLLSASLMKFVHTADPQRTITVLLPAKSLYVLRDDIRYSYTHEIEANSVNSLFKGQPLIKGRRVSIIARSKPLE